ncbi:MAG: DUF4129 domain-containing protein [Cytophagales bacterium]|nr:DUF4129 domain-containing protein [Armatimonadota bacterium]
MKRRRGFQSAGIVVVIGLWATGQAANAETLAEYRDLVAQCQRLLEEPDAEESGKDALRARLARVRRVTYPGGASVPVDTRPLLATLDNSPNADSAGRQLSALRALLLSSEAIPPSGDARDQARRLLAEKEFDALRRSAKSAKSSVPSWWTAFTRWLRRTAERFSEWLRKMTRGPRGTRSPNTGVVEGFVKFLQFLLYFLLGVAALVALYLLARTANARGWLSGLRRKRRRTDPSDLALDLTGEGIDDPLGAARALAARSAYREAIRMAYIASLRRLRDDGFLVLEPNKTNWEYQRELRNRSAAASNTLLPATRLFDRLWYGRRTGTAEEFEAVVRVHDALGTLPPATNAQSADPDGADEADRSVVGGGAP